MAEKAPPEDLEGLLKDFEGQEEAGGIKSLLGDFEKDGSDDTSRKRLGESRKKMWKPPPSSHRWIDLFQDQTQQLTTSAELAVEHLADIRRGEVLSIYSHGTWATEHVCAAIAQSIGPCDFSMMTWAVNDDAVLRLAEAMRLGFIREARVLVDERMKVLRPAALDILQTAVGPGNLATAPCHAKVYIFRAVDPEGLAVSMISSANFTQNPRAEASTIIEGIELAEWWDARIEDVIAHGREYHHTGRLKEAWDD